MFGGNHTVFRGGRGWIRTTESDADRFTVCSLWPLGNPSLLRLFDFSIYGRICQANCMPLDKLNYNNYRCDGENRLTRRFISDRIVKL